MELKTFSLSRQDDHDKDQKRLRIS